MNLLIENGVVEEIECGANFAFILKDNASFVSTDYKVLQSQTNGCFIKCMKMLCNGKIMLYYLVNAYKPLSSLLPTLDPDHFVTVVGHILAGVIDVKNNGFLSCNSIDSSFEHIYVDQNTFKIGLVYVPLNKHEYGDSSAFENALRANLVRVISGISSLASVKTTQLAADLQNGMLSVEEIYSRLGSKGIIVKVNNNKNAEKKPVNPSTAPGSVKLVALRNAPKGAEIVIDKAEFTIGKKELNDFVIKFNNMVSRTHCKIKRNGSKALIVDLQSANGTFINGVRLQPGIPFSLKNGDVVRLANSDFQVVMG